MSKSKTTIGQVTEWFLRRERRWPICSICAWPLLAGERVHWDHIHSEGMGGPHVVDNLRPVHFECHKKKTKTDVQALAKVDRITGKTGQKKRKRKWATRKMPSRRFSSAAGRASKAHP